MSFFELTVRKKSKHSDAYQNCYNIFIARDSWKRASENLKNELEVEANLLASKILMPSHLILEESESNLEQLAKKFEVSPEAMAIKVGTLGTPYDYKN